MKTGVRQTSLVFVRICSKYQTIQTVDGGKLKDQIRNDIIRVELKVSNLLDGIMI